MTMESNNVVFPGSPSGNEVKESINVMSWNILADALGINEFATLGGDKVNTVWYGNRDSKICKVLVDAFLNKDISIIATHENDHPQWLLKEIQKLVPNLDMRIVSSSQPNKDNSPPPPNLYERIYIHRLSHAITTIDNTFECTKMKSKVMKSELLLQYQKCNQWMKNANTDQLETLNQQGFTCTTNEYEMAETSFDETINGEDLYLPSKAGTVLYYDTSKVCLIRHHQEDGRLDFSTKGSNIPFTVFPAHLKSGVTLQREAFRCGQLNKLLSMAQTAPNPIVLMDANSCLQYQNDLQKDLKPDEIESKEWVSDVVKNYGFVNLVPKNGNECIKLRCFGTDQSEKAGNFMFDTIDQILILEQSSHPNNSNKSEFFPIIDNCYPSEYNDDYFKIRTSSTLRGALKLMCKEQKWETDITPHLANMDESFTYYITTYCEQNGIENDAPSLNNGISKLLSNLYPTDKSLPSDHPPIGATIFLFGSDNDTYGTPSKAPRDKDPLITTPMSLNKPSASVAIIGDGSFEALMKERAKLRKEKDEHSIAELRVSMTNIERSLTHEIKRRIESKNYVEETCDEKIAAMEERLHSVMDQHVKEIQRKLGQLEVKVDDLNSRLEEEKERIPADISQRSKDIKDTLQSFIDEFSVERRDRLNREGRIMKQLTDHGELLSAQWNEERKAREEAVAILTEKLDENDRNRASGDANFANLVEEEIAKLREEIELESKERTVEDDEIVEALNRYTEHLQSSLSVISTVGN